MVLVYTSLDKPDYNDEDYQCPVYIPSYSQHVPSLAHLNQTIHHQNACDDVVMGGCASNVQIRKVKFVCFNLSIFTFSCIYLLF